jgi:hypothetical protein
MLASLLFNLQLILFRKGLRCCQFLFQFRNLLKQITLGLHVWKTLIHGGSNTLLSMSIILLLSGLEKKWLLCCLIGHHLGKGIGTSLCTIP